MSRVERGLVGLVTIDVNPGHTIITCCLLVHYSNFLYCKYLILIKVISGIHIHSVAFLCFSFLISIYLCRILRLLSFMISDQPAGNISLLFRPIMFTRLKPSPKTTSPSVSDSYRAFEAERVKYQRITRHQGMSLPHFSTSLSIIPTLEVL